MRHIICPAVAIVISCLVIPLSRAAVVTQAWYKLGEDDGPAAIAGATGQNPTQDSSINNHDLAMTGTPKYSSDTSANSLGSTLSMQFNGTSDGYSIASVVTTATTNVGLEAWIDPASNAPTGYDPIAYNGNGGADGFGIFQANNSGAFGLGSGDLYILRGGVGFTDLGHYSAGTWVHVGIVFDSSGNMQAYVNGTPGATAASANTPSGGFVVGSDGTNFFDGKIDQVRVFTFTGTFDPSDFLIGTSSVPEPASLAVVLALAPMLVRRRRASKT